MWQMGRKVRSAKRAVEGQDREAGNPLSGREDLSNMNLALGTIIQHGVSIQGTCREENRRVPSGSAGRRHRDG